MGLVVPRREVASAKKLATLSAAIGLAWAWQKSRSQASRSRPRSTPPRKQQPAGPHIRRAVRAATSPISAAATKRRRSPAAQLHEHLAHADDARSVRLHAGDDAAERAEPESGTMPRDHELHSAVQRDAGWFAAVDADDRGADHVGRRWQGSPESSARHAGVNAAAAGTARSSLAAATRRRAASRVQTLGPSGQTVFGEVKNYVPITDEMLRNPGSGRLADGAPQLSGLELQSAHAGDARQRQGPASWRGCGRCSDGGANEPTPLVHNGIDVS